MNTSPNGYKPTLEMPVQQTIIYAGILKFSGLYIFFTAYFFTLKMVTANPPPGESCASIVFAEVTLIDSMA